MGLEQHLAVDPGTIRCQVQSFRPHRYLQRWRQRMLRARCEMMLCHVSLTFSLAVMKTGGASDTFLLNMVRKHFISSVSYVGRIHVHVVCPCGRSELVMNPVVSVWHRFTLVCQGMAMHKHRTTLTQADRLAIHR